MSSLGQAVWNRSSEELQVFSYTVSPPDLQTLCQSWAHYQNHLHGLSQPPFFAAIYKNAVELYNVSTQQSTRHTISVDFGDGGSYITLDRRTVMCLGGNPKSTAVYELDLSSLQLTALPPLRTARNGAGVAKTPRFVYVSA